MIIVTGADGQLGSDVCYQLKKLKLNYIGIDKKELDITDKAAVMRFFEENKADSLIHCAAYVAVDKAEEEKEICFAVNEKGTQNLAEACKLHSIKMLYISTDYVFNGEGEEPFETDDDKGPLNVYGESKLKGECAVISSINNYFIVRTSWVFGEKNTNFIATMLRLADTKNELRVVCDQIGSPTYSKDLAKLVTEMIQTEKYGIYHATNEGYCSWYELAAKSFEAADKKIKTFPVTSEEYPTKAKRPKNSRLSKKSLTEAGFNTLPHWKDAVNRYIKNITK